MIVLGDM